MPDTASDRDAARYRQFLEAAPDAMLVVDAAGTIVVANVLAERLFGYRREALLGQPIEILVPERARGRHVGLRQAFVAAPQTRAMASGLDLAVRRRDGSEFPAEISLGPLQIADKGCSSWPRCATSRSSAACSARRRTTSGSRTPWPPSSGRRSSRCRSRSSCCRRSTR